MSNYCKNCYELQQQLDQLKSENETLFKAIEKVNKINKKLKANLLDQEAETLKAGGIIHGLEKNLTEIKEISEKYKTLNFGEQQYCYGEILKKISEVMPNEN